MKEERRPHDGYEMNGKQDIITQVKMHMVEVQHMLT